jgi:hypothetical protein
MFERLVVMLLQHALDDERAGLLVVGEVRVEVDSRALGEVRHDDR